MNLVLETKDRQSCYVKKANVGEQSNVQRWQNVEPLGSTSGVLINFVFDSMFFQ